MEAWSTQFLDEHIHADSWATCILPIDSWRRITEEYPASRLVAQIHYATKTFYATLGTPIQQSQPTSANAIYLPGWILDHLGIDGTGQSVHIEWLSQEAFPEASKIVLRPHDSAFYHADAKDELERSLTHLGVMRQGDTIMIPLKCLGGYEIAFDIVATEPTNIVLAHGDEVSIEFEEALDAITVPRPSTPIPLEIPTLIVPTEEEPAGQQLGGQTARYMPNGTRWNPWRDGPWNPIT